MPDFAIGARVRLRAPSPTVRLRSNVGTIIAADKDDGYWLVHLAAPYTSQCEPGILHTMIVEDEENLDLLDA